ncbi:hypothetical protein CQ042_11605 [Microbacterium sp. MYb62]|nr:hypothetical protein CQ042_11605 [Microbacterium sp. MYb62]
MGFCRRSNRFRGSRIVGERIVRFRRRIDPVDGVDAGEGGGDDGVPTLGTGTDISDGRLASDFGASSESTRLLVRGDLRG